MMKAWTSSPIINRWHRFLFKLEPFIAGLCGWTTEVLW